MKVLVTGAAGFVGSHLVDRLLADGHEVTGVDDLSTGLLDDLAAAHRKRGLTFHRADVIDDALVDLVVDDAPEVVVHLVRARVADPVGHARTTVVGTARVLEAAAAAGARKVVLGCGPQVYGRPRAAPVTERAGLVPTTAYGAAQVGALALLDTSRLATTALVFADVYGPRLREGLVAELARALARDEPAGPVGPGLDLVHVADAVDAVVRALDDRADGRRLHVGTGELSTPALVQHLLVRAAGHGRDAAPAEVRRPVSGVPLDSGAAFRALGWEAGTRLEDGLRATWEWARREWGRRRR